MAGVDGCRGGWLVVTTDVASAVATTEVEVVASIVPVVERVRTGAIAALGIDMPIGLPARGRRASDQEARRILGPRRSSLFPTPPEAVLAASDYADALARCRAVDGVGISVQAYNLLPKMRELAAAVTPELAPAIAEVHPETTFAVMAGAPCAHPKRTDDGARERATLLRVAFPDVDRALAARPRGAGRDDVLDAFAVAWTARRIALGTATWLGDRDARSPRGLPLTIAV